MKHVSDFEPDKRDRSNLKTASNGVAPLIRPLCSAATDLCVVNNQAACWQTMTFPRSTSQFAVLEMFFYLVRLFLIQLTHANLSSPPNQRCLPNSWILDSLRAADETSEQMESSRERIPHCPPPSHLIRFCQSFQCSRHLSIRVIVGSARLVTLLESIMTFFQAVRPDESACWPDSAAAAAGKATFYEGKCSDAWSPFLVELATTRL